MAGFLLFNVEKTFWQMCPVEEGVEIFISTFLSKPLETLCSEGSHGILI